jgi:hypothetical protein
MITPAATVPGRMLKTVIEILLSVSGNEVITLQKNHNPDRIHIIYYDDENAASGYRDTGTYPVERACHCAYTLWC